jgi:hypothetical protein
MENYEGCSFPPSQTQLSTFSPDWMTYGQLLTDVSVKLAEQTNKQLA